METILIPNPRDFDGFVEVLATRKWNALTGVNTLFAALLAHPKFGQPDFSNVKLVLSGGMALQTRRCRQVGKRSLAKPSWKATV